MNDLKAVETSIQWSQVQSEYMRQFGANLNKVVCLFSISFSIFNSVVAADESNFRKRRCGARLAQLVFR